jgi:hypothetical protein
MGDKPAPRRKEAIRVDRRQAGTGRGRNDGVAMAGGEPIRHYDQTAARAARDGGNGSFDPGVVADRGGAEHQSQRGAGGQERMHEEIRIDGGVRVEQDVGVGGGRRDLLEELRPFAGDRRFEIGEAGDIAARTSKACDKAAADRIGRHDEHDRDRAGLSSMK